jgi:hypothetical protein
MGIPGYFPCFVTVVLRCILLYRTTCDTLEHTTAQQHFQCIPDTSATPEALQASGAAYYNKVYKERSPVMDPCQTVQHTADHSSPAGSAPTACGSLANATLGAPAEGSVSPPAQGQPGGVSILPKPDGLQSDSGQSPAPSTRRSSPAAWARRAARNHWRLSPQLFSGFRPIANRGQQ